jgi:hypothetical protein
MTAEIFRGALAGAGYPAACGAPQKGAAGEPEKAVGSAISDVLARLGLKMLGGLVFLRPLTSS